MGRVRFRLAMIAVAVTMFGVATSSIAGEPVNPADLKKALTARGEVKAIEPLPLNQLMMVETTSGDVYYVSSNGRFVMTGTLIDTWHRKTVDSIDDAKSTHRVPLKNMGIKEGDLGVFVFGNPKLPKQGTIFVDPLCGYCKQLLSDMALSLGDYHFDIVPVAVLGPSSEQALKRIWCAKDRNQALLDLMYMTSAAVEQQQECDLKPLAYNAVAFEMMALGGTPAIVRTDGLVSKGVPKDLNKWLKSQ